MTDKGRLSKYYIFFVCWILSIFIILLFAAKTYLKDNKSLNFLSKNWTFDSALPKNELGTFSFIHFDSKANYRPVYGIAFEKLLLTNNSIGPFKTAMHKKAIISDLKVHYYKNEASQNFVNTDAFAVEELINQTNGILRPSKEYDIGNFNFSNVSEIYADKFNCKYFSEDTLLLSIKSRKAVASYKNSTIKLSGHVTIKTKSGTTLESNQIEWDIRNNIFKVKGLFVLNSNGNIKTGRDSNFDFNLKEENKCIAKL